MGSLATALARRDAILDAMLALAEWGPVTRKRAALNTFMLTGHQEQAQPARLRSAQTEVLRLLE